MRAAVAILVALALGGGSTAAHAQDGDGTLGRWMLHQTFVAGGVNGDWPRSGSFVYQFTSGMNTTRAPVAIVDGLDVLGSFTSLAGTNFFPTSVDWMSGSGTDLGVYLVVRAGITSQLGFLRNDSPTTLADLAVFDTNSTALTLRATAPAGIYCVRVYARNACAVSIASNDFVLVLP